ncbi:paired domain-containing protein [Trichonephila clavipes]|nr:paired domain-containing protein [Trichonephila clavipes]
MSERSRLHDSLRWRAVGWMEMGLSQADASRRLNVSRRVIHRLWNQYQSEASVSRRHVPGRPRATTPAENSFIALSTRRRSRSSVPQLVAEHSVASGRRISASTVEGVFTMQVSKQGDQLCVYPSTDDRERPAFLGQENTLPGPDSDGLPYSLQTSPHSHWRAIQDVCSSGGNEAPDTINTKLLKDTVTEVVE